MNLFIDTNVFLSFFHLSNDDLEEIHKLAVLLEKKSIRLLLTKQVKDEFNRNRESKIADAIKRLKEQKIKLQFPQFCKDYEEYPELTEIQKQLEKKISTLIEKVTVDVSGRTLKADQKISELFDKATLIPTTAELVAKARLRMDIGNPPGKNGSLGDAINWEAMLEAVPANEKLYLIADDKDYFSVLDENKAKDFLTDEWKEAKKSEIVFYRRLSQFFKEHYPEIKLASELEKELAIRSLASSSNFASTHAAIAKISKYSEFSKLQANELAQAALSNSQVNWILCDSDVSEFYAPFLKSHEHLIEPELSTKLSKALVACETSTDEEDI